MLRQIGYSSVASASMSFPEAIALCLADTPARSNDGMRLHRARTATELGFEQLSIEIGIVGIALRYHDPFDHGPLDGKGRIVPAQTRGQIRGVDIGHLIEHLGPVAEGHKSMRHPV